MLLLVPELGGGLDAEYRTSDTAQWIAALLCRGGSRLATGSKERNSLISAWLSKGTRGLSTARQVGIESFRLNMTMRIVTRPGREQLFERSQKRVQIPIHAAEVDHAFVHDWGRHDRADSDELVEVNVHVFEIVEHRSEERLQIQTAVRVEHF